jgi:hypothetical protein
LREKIEKESPCLKKQTIKKDNHYIPKLKWEVDDERGKKRDVRDGDGIPFLPITLKVDWVEDVWTLAFLAAPPVAVLLHFTMVKNKLFLAGQHL